MKLIVCVDDRGGMMFGGRRQSMDRVLREKMLAITAGHTLWMSEYSAKQFATGGDFQVCECPAEQAGADDFCFVEDTPFSLDGCTQVWVFRWNRHYPADVFFDVDLHNEGFALISTEEFVGSSHPNIMLNGYQRGNV